MPAPEGIKGNERRNGNADSRQFGSFSSLIKTAIASPRRRRFNQPCFVESVRTGEGCPSKSPRKWGWLAFLAALLLLLLLSLCRLALSSELLLLSQLLLPSELLLLSQLLLPS
jgi:hypothetical protein